MSTSLSSLIQRWIQIVRDAKDKWFTPEEAIFCLTNFNQLELKCSDLPPQSPQSGDIYFYNRETTSTFKLDGISWTKKKNQNRIQETYDTFHIDGFELHRVNCRSADNLKFQRRIYRLVKCPIDGQYSNDIVLVHYRLCNPTKYELKLSSKDNRSSSNDILTSLTSQYNEITPPSIEETEMKVNEIGNTVKYTIVDYSPSSSYHSISTKILIYIQPPLAQEYLDTSPSDDIYVQFGEYLVCVDILCPVVLRCHSPIIPITGRQMLSLVTKQRKPLSILDPNIIFNFLSPPMIPMNHMNLTTPISTTSTAIMTDIDNTVYFGNNTTSDSSDDMTRNIYSSSCHSLSYSQLPNITDDSKKPLESPMFGAPLTCMTEYSNNSPIQMTSTIPPTTIIGTASLSRKNSEVSLGTIHVYSYDRLFPHSNIILASSSSSSSSNNSDLLSGMKSDCNINTMEVQTKSSSSSNINYPENKRRNIYIDSTDIPTSTISALKPISTSMNHFNSTHLSVVPTTTVKSQDMSIFNPSLSSSYHPPLSSTLPLPTQPLSSSPSSSSSSNLYHVPPYIDNDFPSSKNHNHIHMQSNIESNMSNIESNMSNIESSHVNRDLDVLNHRINELLNNQHIYSQKDTFSSINATQEDEKRKTNQLSYIYNETSLHSNSTSATTAATTIATNTANTNIYELESLTHNYLLRTITEMIELATDDDNLQSELDALTSNGYNFMHYCCIYNLYEMLDILLSKGGNPNIYTKNHKTCLHLCVKYSTIQICKLLLHYDADVTLCDNHQRTPLQLAIECRKQEFVDCLSPYYPHSITGFPQASSVNESRAQLYTQMTTNIDNSLNTVKLKDQDTNSLSYDNNHPITTYDMNKGDKDSHDDEQVEEDEDEEDIPSIAILQDVFKSLSITEKCALAISISQIKVPIINKDITNTANRNIDNSKNQLYNNTTREDPTTESDIHNSSKGYLSSYTFAIPQNNDIYNVPKEIHFNPTESYANINAYSHIANSSSSSGSITDDKVPGSTTHKSISPKKSVTYTTQTGNNTMYNLPQSSTSTSTHTTAADMSEENSQVDMELHSVISEQDMESLQTAMRMMGDQELEEIDKEVRRIQNNVRGWLLRKNYVNLRTSALTLQNAWRERKRSQNTYRNTAMSSTTKSASNINSMNQSVSSTNHLVRSSGSSSHLASGKTTLPSIPEHSRSSNTSLIPTNTSPYKNSTVVDITPSHTMNMNITESAPCISESVNVTNDDIDADMIELAAMLMDTDDEHSPRGDTISIMQVHDDTTHHTHINNQIKDSSSMNCMHSSGSMHYDNHDNIEECLSSQGTFTQLKIEQNPSHCIDFPNTQLPHNTLCHEQIYTSIDTYDLFSSSSETDNAIISLQAVTRGMIARKAFASLRQQAIASIVIQKKLLSWWKQYPHSNTTTSNNNNNNNNNNTGIKNSILNNTYTDTSTNTNTTIENNIIRPNMKRTYSYE